MKQTINRVLLKKMVKEVILEKVKLRSKLNVYDFDSTLAITKEKVIIKTKDGSVAKLLTPHEYAEYQKSSDEIADYSLFKTVKDAEINKPVFDSFIRSIKNISSKDTTYILTARGNDSGIWINKFLQDNDVIFPQSHIITLDSSDPLDKSNWIKHKMIDLSISTAFFCDDSIRNVNAVDLLKQDPILKNKFGKTLRIKTKHIKMQ